MLRAIRLIMFVKIRHFLQRTNELTADKAWFFSHSGVIKQDTADIQGPAVNLRR